MTPYSAAAGGSFSRRRELALGRLRSTSSGRLVASIRSRSSLTSACSVVALAELVLDRLELLAEEVLALPLVDLRGDLRLDLRAELHHLELAARGCATTLRSRSSTSTVSSRSWRSPVFSRSVDATRWQSALGSSTLAAASCSSSGRYGRQPDDPRELGSGRSASAPPPRASPGRRRAAPRTPPTRYGSSPAGSTSRIRSSPWTRMRSVPSGTLIILWMTARVPTS